MKSHYRISGTSINQIQKELDHIMRNAIHTPDVEASYKCIVGILQSLEGV